MKTSVPQPAVSVKRRGPRSRAGLIAPPQLADIDMEIPSTITATIGGISPEVTGVFLFSSKPRMHNISMPVPTTYWEPISSKQEFKKETDVSVMIQTHKLPLTWSRKLLPKDIYSDGYVANIDAVSLGPYTVKTPPLKSMIASRTDTLRKQQN